MRLYFSVFIVVLIMVGILKPVYIFSGTGFIEHASDVNQDEIHHYTILKNDTGGWYFKIYEGSKAFINQNQIPAVSGIKAFSDSIQAASIAQLMMNKLIKGVFPPVITIEELDSLKIIY